MIRIPSATLMLSTLRSIWIWFATGSLIVIWVPVLAVSRFFERDPIRYRTGLLFRKLGATMSKVNPLWTLNIVGERISDMRRPYVVVSNHQSHADVPLISNLPGEMKWLAKVELFRMPFVGWLLKMAGDIPVDRGNKRQGAEVLIAIGNYLKQKCSVMIFPEGTRSPDGRVQRFNEGAFRIAIREQAPILPLAIEGSRDCLPKHSWKFGDPANIVLKVFRPIETTGLKSQDSDELCERVRQLIIKQIAEWRNVPIEEVDALVRETHGENVS
jgi:1-acyl-sn-glycerol-3-phosphate acyltransferase